jgi:hypothetical protein
MSQADSANTTTFVSRSVVVRVRCPREFLACVEAWATERGVPRSEAFRLLAYRGLAQCEVTDKIAA